MCGSLGMRVRSVRITADRSGLHRSGHTPRDSYSTRTFLMPRFNSAILNRSQVPRARDFPSCCVLPQDSSSKSISPGQPVNRVRVLLADDNRLFLELTVKMLASSFDIVGIAHDGQDLISKALLLTPDVIVVDITMPIVTGIEAVHQLRKTGLAARFVFLTIHSEDEFLQACLEEGAVGYVVKPHMKADLIPAINAAIGGKVFVSPALSTPEKLQ